ncbi:unnamed protein product [Closterium sp. NIES-54]
MRASKVRNIMPAAHAGGVAAMDAVAESPCPVTAAADVDHRARAPQLRQRAPTESSAGSESRPARLGAGRRAANTARSRQYLARWTPEEDAVLLEHVMAHGTAEWGQLRASGRLPLRDNKACCNRFLLLKKYASAASCYLNGMLQPLPDAQEVAVSREAIGPVSPARRSPLISVHALVSPLRVPRRKFLQLDDQPQLHQQHQEQQHYQHYQQPQQHQHLCNGQLLQQHDISPWPCPQHHAHPAALPCCFQPAGTAPHLIATAAQAYPQAAQARQQSMARHGGWEGEWIGSKADWGSPEGAMWWEGVMHPHGLGGALMGARGWDGAMACGGVSESVRGKSAREQCNVVLLQRHTDAVKQKQQNYSDGVRPYMEQAVKASACAAPSACCAEVHPRPVPAAITTAPSHPPLAALHPAASPLLLPSLPPSTHVDPASPLSASSSNDHALPLLQPLPRPLLPPAAHLHAPQPLAALRCTNVAPPAALHPASAAAAPAAAACVGAGPLNRLSQADLDRWVLEQVGIMVGGQGGAAPGCMTLLADARGGGDGGVDGELGGMRYAEWEGEGMVGHGGKGTRLSDGGEWDEQQGEACTWEGYGIHCGGWMGGGEGGGGKRLEQEGERVMLNQECGELHAVAKEGFQAYDLDAMSISNGQLLRALQSVASAEDIDGFVDQYGFGGGGCAASPASPPPPSPTAAAAAEGGGCVWVDGVVLGGGV